MNTKRLTTASLLSDMTLASISLSAQVIKDSTAINPVDAAISMRSDSLFHKKSYKGDIHCSIKKV